MAIVDHMLQVDAVRFMNMLMKFREEYLQYNVYFNSEHYEPEVFTGIDMLLFDGDRTYRHFYVVFHFAENRYFVHNLSNKYIP